MPFVHLSQAHLTPPPLPPPTSPPPLVVAEFISSTAALEQSTAAKKILVAQAEEEHAQAVAAQSELQERCDAAQVKRAAIESEAAELVANHDEMVAQTEAVQKEATEKSRIAKWVMFMPFAPPPPSPSLPPPSQLGSSCALPLTPPLPSTSRNALSLYVNITHILWDYDSEEKVAGYVSNATTERVIPFDIDATTTSEFDVAAQLWESVALASNVEAVVAC